MAKNKIRELKVKNTKKVLDTIIKYKGISRTEIASICDLAPSTVGQATSILLENSIIEETREGESSGGRKPILLSIRSKYACVLVMEIKRSGIEAIIYDLKGNVFDTIAVSATRLKGTELLEAIASCVEGVKNGEVGFTSHIIGVGLLCQDDIPDYDLNVEFSTSVSSDIIRLETAVAARCGLPVKKELINRYNLDYYLKKSKVTLANYAYINVGERITASFIQENTLIKKNGEAEFDISDSILKPWRDDSIPEKSTGKEVAVLLKRLSPEEFSSKIKRVIRSAMIFFTVDHVYIGGEYEHLDELVKALENTTLLNNRVQKMEFKGSSADKIFARSLLMENSRNILQDSF